MECLRSVFNMTFRNFEVILIDNGSTDGSGQAVLNTFQSVRVVHLDRNMGYGSAVNRGIAASEGKYVALLDNDTVVSQSWLSELVRAMEADSTVGIVGSKVYFYSSERTICSAGALLNPINGFVRVLGFGEKDVGQLNKPRTVDWVAGCSILIRRDILEKIGYLDEDYEFYREEVDLCHRTRLANYFVLYVPTSIVWHKMSITALRLGLKFYYLHRSWIRFVLIHASGSSVLPGVLFAVFFTLGESFGDFWRGNKDSVRQAVCAISWNVKHLPATLHRRMELRYTEASIT